MKKNSLISLLLLGALLVSCGHADSTGKDTSDENQTVTGSETAAVTEDPYEYPELDCGGAALRILNSNNTWGTYGSLDFESTTGESLDDIIFNRNRGLEERFNMVIEVNDDHDIDEAASHLTTVIMSAEDLYDVSYLRCDDLPPMITQQMLYDLEEIEGFRLNEPWWDAAIVDGGHIGEDKRLYFAANYHSLFSFESTVCMYFNEQVFDSYDLAFPYQQVREGTWTLDSMYTYMKAVSNLNGDADFTWNANGNSVYGISTWAAGYHALLNAAGAYYLMMDANGNPEITVDDEHFMNVAQTLTENVFNMPGGIINSAVSSPPYDLVEVFRRNRSVFCISQVKAATLLRDMEDNFGVLPLPKYDEAQHNYACYISSTQLLMSIPITNNNTERTAILMDAIAYESYRDVLPVYYEEKISQKGLRNEDSIEMLDVIRDNRYVNFGEIFGWTNSLQSSIYNKLNSGSSDISSDIASAMKKIEASIEATMELVGK